jgi:murein DD-endopeptidase MepM/ murein hydrolase activator NlpD
VVPGKKQFAAGGFVREDVVSSTLKINSNFGWRHGRMHTGVDLDGDTGQRVGASMAGIVKFAGHKRGYGNLIVLDHGHGINTYYAHLSAILVELEAPIEAGQVIGLVGSTGRSSGPHLHYEVRANGKPLNPFGTIVLDEDKVWVDGQLVTAPAGDEWGDAEEAAEPGGEPARTVRIPARQPRSVPTKKIIVYGSDSLTEY